MSSRAAHCTNWPVRSCYSSMLMVFMLATLPEPPVPSVAAGAIPVSQARGGSAPLLFRGSFIAREEARI
jgi:hypothetical protein